MSAVAPDTTLHFDALRMALITHAQAASSDSWSDYNLHDPGVTLLEQTAFAISELAFRARLPVRDLVAGADGTIDLAALGLASAPEVLTSAPITAADLEAYLAALPEVARAGLDVDGSGRITLRIVPQDGTQASDALRAARRSFAAVRPLCTRLQSAHTCTALPVRLRGRMIVAHQMPPEDVAAEIWMRVNLHLRGVQLPGDGGAGMAPASGRSAIFTAMRAVEGLQEIIQLDLVGEDGTLHRNFRTDDPDAYLALQRPDAQAGFSVIQNGIETPLDPARIDREIGRFRARFLAQGDGDVPPAGMPVGASLAGRDPISNDAAQSARAGAFPKPPTGRPRRFEYTSVNATLPIAYQQTAGTPAALQLAGYRSLIDAMLGAMTADLHHLADVMAADATRGHSHFGHLPALAAEAGLIANAANWHAAFASHDRPEAQLAGLMDFLLAVQGEAMPSDTRAGLECDVPRALRAQAMLQRRARLLRALPALNARRATGPQGVDPGGVLGHLLCLIDMPARTPAAVEGALGVAGLRLDPLAQAGQIARGALTALAFPGDLIVPERDVPVAMMADLGALPCCAGGAIPPDLLHAAALGDSWLVMPETEGWQVLIETSAQGAASRLYDAGRYGDRDIAIGRANALRGAFAMLNRACEGAWLIEDILLGDLSGRGRPFGATLVLPGWSLRCASPSYRQHVVQMIARVAPAHCDIRAVWLSPDRFAAFADLHAELPLSRDVGRVMRALLDTDALT